jgi:hypothetical protein
MPAGVPGLGLLPGMLRPPPRAAAEEEEAPLEEGNSSASGDRDDLEESLYQLRSPMSRLSAPVSARGHAVPDVAHGCVFVLMAKLP